MADLKQTIVLEGKNKTKRMFGEAQRDLQKIGLQTKKLDRGFSGLSRSLLGIGAALGTAFSVKSVIDITARYEDLRTTLSSVAGSAEEGAKAFEFVSEFATKTQFGVEELAQTYIKLSSNGIEPSVELLTKFTDAAAVTTDQIGSLQSITDFYTRSLQSQTVELTDLERLSDRGLPVYDIIKSKLGIARGEISKFSKEVGGTVKIVEALGEGISERFGGSTEARVNNLSTRMSNLNIAITNAADTLGQGLNQALGETIVDITKLIESNDELIKQFGVDLGDAIESAAEFAKELKGPMQDIGAVIATMIDGFKSLPEFVKSVGIIGAILFGKKGFAALAGISYVFGKIKEEVNDFQESIKQAELQIEGDVQARLNGVRDEIQRIQGEILRIELNPFKDDKDSILDPTKNLEGLYVQLNAMLEERAKLEALLNEELEEKSNLEKLIKQDIEDRINREKSLKNVIDESTKAKKENNEEDKKIKDEFDPVEAGRLAELAIFGMPKEQYMRDLDQRVQAIREALYTQEEEVYASYHEQVKTVRHALNLQRISHQYASDLIAKIEKSKEDKITQIKKEAEEERRRIAEENFRKEMEMRGVSQADIEKRIELENASRAEQGKFILDNAVKTFEALGQQNKKAFAAYKAFAIAQTLIDTYASAQSAFKSLVGIPIVGPALAFSAAAAAVAAGIARVNAIKSQTYSGRQMGGPVGAGQTYLVGEAGPELFQAPPGGGTIVPNSGFGGEVNINFNVEAVDAQSFTSALAEQRETIVAIVNEAVNDGGRRSITA